MGSQLTIILSVSGALCLWCAGYAWALEHTPFPERDTWKTVVIGNGFILIAIGIDVLLGAVDAAVYWLCVGYNAAGGLPVIIWQLVHYAKEQGRVEAVVAPRHSNGQEEPHAIDTRRG